MRIIRFQTEEQQREGRDGEQAEDGRLRSLFHELILLKLHRMFLIDPSIIDKTGSEKYMFSEYSHSKSSNSTSISRFICFFLRMNLDLTISELTHNYSPIARFKNSSIAGKAFSAALRPRE